MLSESYVMKTRFLLASKASELYCEVSEMFVIPGVNWLTGLCLENESDDTIEKTVIEIGEWRTKICVEAERLTATASGHLTWFFVILWC
jgi:hypothetical protein